MGKVFSGRVKHPSHDMSHNICIKGGLIRDLIGYSLHEKQDNNLKELIKYLCTE